MMYKPMLLLVSCVLMTLNAEASDKIQSIRSFNQTKQDSMNIEQYGEKIAGLLLESDWEGIVNEIHPINLPDGWQEMIKPFFEDGFGRELAVEIILFEELPDHQLHWLKMAPEQILNKTQQAIRLSFDYSTEDETDKGKLELAVYQHDANFSILLVGGE